MKNFFRCDCPRTISIIFIIFPVAAHQQFFVSSFFSRGLYFPVNIGTRYNRVTTVGISGTFLNTTPNITTFGSLTSLSKVSYHYQVNIQAARALVGTGLIATSQLLSKLSTTVTSGELTS